MSDASAVPINRHVTAMIADAKQASEMARHLCTAAGHDPEARAFWCWGVASTVPMWLGFLGQAYGFINLRAGRPVQPRA